MNCPFCNGETDIIVNDTPTVMCFCKKCELPFVIQTGEDVREWYNEVL